MLKIPKSLKEKADIALEIKGYTMSSYLQRRIGDFCDEIEAKREKGELKELIGKKRRWRKHEELKEEMFKGSFSLQPRLRDRFNQSIDFVDMNKMELYERFLQELVDEVNSKRKQ